MVASDSIEGYELAAGDEFGVPIHIFAKNSSQQIRISLNEYKGVQYIDIRQFYISENGFRPTKKGVTLRTDLYLELLNGVVLLGEALGYDNESLSSGS